MAATVCSRSSSWCAIAPQRAPLSEWPDTHPALKALLRDALARDVSFASRGNLIILAPPLVIGENELQDALSLLDQLLAGIEDLKSVPPCLTS